MLKGRNMFKKLTIGKLLIAYLCVVYKAIASFPQGSEIYTISSMQELEKYVDKQTIVLLDLDHTIFEGNYYGYGHANWFYDQIEKGKAQGIEEKITIARIFPHWLHSQKSTKVKPVELLTPELIKKLQNEGTLVVGLTSRQVPLVDITLNQLKEINIEFDDPRLPKETISMLFKAPTMMKGGTIFCSEYNDKGEVLHAYLDRLNIFPNKILFVDDSYRNLQSVIKAYSSQAMVVGLYYPLVAEYKKQHWNAERAHQEYYDVYLSTSALKAYPLENRNEKNNKLNKVAA